MNDFIRRFEKYSNTDLLKIIHKPDDYQPEALETARQILSTRLVSEDEKKEVEIFYEEKAFENNLRKEKIDAYSRKVTDFLEPILKPGEQVSPSKWLEIFLVLVALQYIYLLVKAIIDIIKYIQREVPIDWQILISLIGLVYIPFLFTLLYKRKRWGWILLMADNILSVVILLSQSYYIFKYQEYFPVAPIDFIWQTCIRIVFILFLWRNDISDYFNIESDSKIRISVILAVISGLIALLIYGLSLN